MRGRIFFVMVLMLSVAPLCWAVAPLYTIGNVPPQQVVQGDVLQIALASPKNGAASFSYTVDPGYPSPQGAIILNGSTGLVTYSPVPADKFQFSLRFMSLVPGQPADSQSVVIRPITPLLAESDAIVHTTLPDAASTDYLIVTQSQNPATEMFNGKQQSTINIEITGKTVVFDSSSLNYGRLYTRFHGRANMKNVTIYAETLIIRSPLKLPGTNFAVYAQKILFEDSAGQASIDTTPLGHPTSADQFQNGLPGQKGGDIKLVVQSYQSQPGPSTRLISVGGAGQAAGQGAHGSLPSPSFAFPTTLSVPVYVPLTPTTGKPYSNLWALFNEFPWLTDHTGPVVSAPTIGGCSAAFAAAKTSPQIWHTPYPNAVYVQVWNGSLGTKVWPGDGGNAQAGGKPGDGGQGGDISSLIPLPTTLWVQTGGLGGAKAAAQAGGTAGQPNPAVWITYTNEVGGQWYYCVTDSHSSQAGSSWVPLSPDIPIGASGTFTKLTGSNEQWLHPYFLRQVIAHAKDAYRGGNFEFAQDTFTTYMDLLTQYGTPPTEYALAFEQAKQEMEGLLFQISNKLDYFGNGYGWVPLLSLEANMSAFNTEVDTAIPLLYLSQYLQSKSDQNQKDVNALQDTMTKLDAEVKQTAAEVNTALKNVPSLQFQAQQIAIQVDTVQAALKQREAELIAKARDNVEDSKKVPEWQTGLKVLSTVAAVASLAVPALTPVAAGLAAGTKLLTATNAATPWEQIKGYGNIAKGFLDTDYGVASEQLQKELDGIDLSDPPTAKEFAQKIANAAAKPNTFIEQQIKDNQALQITDADVDKEYKKLRAQDGVLNDLIKQVANLQVQKAAFQAALNQTNQTISKGTATITQDLVAINSVYQNLDVTVTQVDHATAVYVRDMDRRARERLIRYQYYMAKSYEYRMLQPFPDDLNLQCGDPSKCVIDKILAVMSTDSYPVNSASLTAIKEVYKESVRQIVYSALTRYQTQPHDTSLPFLLELTPPELQELNQTGQVSIDISNRIPGQPNEQNRHIVNVGVDFMGVQATGQIPPGAARVRTIIAHQGRSTETLNGHTYEFYFGTSPNDKPFVWGASYDLLSNQLAQETPGPSVVSFMRTVLNLPASTGDVSVLFARPGADAILTITKAPTPIDLPAQITKLRLAVTVDFFRINSSQVRLSVQAANGNGPYVSLDQPDVTGRSDGAGTFQRTFNSGQQVTLVAEPVVGNLIFRSWVDDNGVILGRTPSLKIVLTASYSVHPVYSALSTSPMPDLDGNSVPDLIWQNANTNQVAAWYLGGPQGNLYQRWDWLSAGSQPNWRVVSLADLNQDGIPDLIWQNQATTQIAVWYMGGPQGNTYQSWDWLAAGAAAPGWTVVGVADMDQNGVPDLIWQNQSTTQVAVWYMGGAQGNLYQGWDWLAGGAVAPGWTIVGVRDINQDSVPDLIWQNQATTQVAVWYMGGLQGNVYQSWSWLASAGAPGWTIVGVRDINKDNVPDLIWQNLATTQVAVWFMGGTQGNIYQSWNWIADGASASGWKVVAP